MRARAVAAFGIGLTRAYIYDPDRHVGEMTATVTTGLLRYVGGKISKQQGAQFLTPSGAVTVRGGIAVIQVTPKQEPRS